MMRYTVFLNGELVKSYDLDEPVVFIGRLPENHIPISNMGISRRHVKIELDPQGGYTLSDLNSLNGTLVNGKRVKKVPLCHGDKITIGKHTIVYEDMNSSSAAFLETIVAEVRPEDLQRMAMAAGMKMPAPPAPMAAPPLRPPPSTPPLGMPPIQQQTALSPALMGPSTEAVPVPGNPVFIETSNHIVYKLDRSMHTIGSDDEDDIYASGFGVGKAFAAIEQRDGGFYISVQKMIKKVKVNGKSLKTHRLEHRDRIEIGSNTFRFMENG